jgi:hypothetical protein
MSDTITPVLRSLLDFFLYRPRRSNELSGNRLLFFTDLSRYWYLILFAIWLIAFANANANANLAIAFRSYRDNARNAISTIGRCRGGNPNNHSFVGPGVVYRS